MKKFNIRINNLELRSVDSPTDLAEIIFHREKPALDAFSKPKKDEICIASFVMDEKREFSLKIKTYQLKETDEFDSVIFNKLLKVLLSMIEKFWLRPDERLTWEGRLPGEEGLDFEEVPTDEELDNMEDGDTDDEEESQEGEP